MTDTQAPPQRTLQGDFRRAHFPFDDLEVKVKTKEPDGAGIVLTGYTSKWGYEDSYKDVMQKGCAKKTLKKDFPYLRALWQHSTDHPFGLPVKGEVYEDDVGIFTTTRMLLTDTNLERLSLIEQGGVTGMSIGFFTIKAKLDEDDDDSWWPRRYIQEIELIEYSYVTFAALRQAEVDEVQKQLQLRHMLQKAGQMNRLDQEMPVDLRLIDKDLVHEAIERLTALAEALETGGVLLDGAPPPGDVAPTEPDTPADPPADPDSGELEPGDEAETRDADELMAMLRGEVAENPEYKDLLDEIREAGATR